MTKIDTLPTTWNQAAAIASTEIFDSLDDFHINVGSIRTTFERLSTSYFHDNSDCSKERVATLWTMLGAYSLGWGSNNGITISRDDLVATLVRKQRDYGHNNIAKYGRQGLIIRVHDKIARLENLITKNSAAQNEPISDTILDIAGYSSIGIMWERGTFMLPLD